MVSPVTKKGIVKRLCRCCIQPFRLSIGLATINRSLAQAVPRLREPRTDESLWLRRVLEIIVGRMMLYLLSLMLFEGCVTALSGASVVFGASLVGVYALSDGRAAIPPAVLSNPNVDGLALRYWWDELEPREGAFDWRQIDDQIAAAHAHGKKVSLGVTAGIHTPDWVYARGASYFTFVWDKSWGPPVCSKQRIPIPWDSVYLARWTAFVRSVGARYAGNPSVVYIKITGINAGTQETLLP